MLFQIKSYLKFLWNSKNAHGVHSPFVFDLVTKCFYDTEKYAGYSVLKQYRNSLLQNKDVISVTDFGAGSKIFKSNDRQIAQIAKTAGIGSKRAELLFRTVNYFKSAPGGGKPAMQNILEIGTSLGLATAALSLANENAEVTTLEGCPETAKTAKLQLQKVTGNVNVVNTEFGRWLKNRTPDGGHFQLVYFDGNHSEQATLQYFELLLPTITNDTVWIFDDIHWSEEMNCAWELIKQNPKVTVTIDTFQWGFVFFRYQQQKQNFIIRSTQSKLLDAVLGIKKLYGLLD